MIKAIKDSIMLKKIKEKDIDAVLSWFEARKSKFYKIGWAYLKNHHDVEDVFHNTILKVHDHIDKLKQDRYFETWVTSIYINEYRDLYRRNKRRQQEAAIEGNESGQLPSDRLDVLDALGQVDEKFREPILLKYIQGFSQEEIAGILGLPLGTVKSRIYRGLLILRKEYGGAGSHDMQ
ncbi:MULTISPECIES: RNA polymerase sigma factor [Bacillus]|uniref:RNA polymerase sigma factor n=1 Tax=Bacillus TaxID=1386 RepID=UPI002880FD61|nr:RNA polymerase sigma factor [Bacillus sp. AG4(2022)]MDT0163359.1 RNA polymerase sigma factor [Bacillus sp. AG4(2022)]